MKIKNLFLAIGITCTTAAGILNNPTKITTPVKAEDNNTLVSEYSNNRKFGYADGNIVFQYIDRYISDVDNDQFGTNYCITTYLQNENINGILINVTLYFKPNKNIYNTVYNPTWKNTNSETLGNRIDYQLTGRDATDYMTEVTTLEDVEDIKYYFLQAEEYYDNIQNAEWNTQEKTNLPNMTINESYIYSSTYIWANDIEMKLTDTFPKFKPYNETTPGGTITLYNAPTIVVTPGNNENYEIVDIPGLMIKIISMPFTFISTAFNLTLFPGTQYQVNIGQFILGLIAIMTIIFIIKVFTGGLDIVGNITQSAKTATKPKASKETETGWISTTTTSGTDVKGRHYTQTTTKKSERNK